MNSDTSAPPSPVSRCTFSQQDNRGVAALLVQQEARPVTTATMTVQADMQVWKLQHAGRYLLHVCHRGSGITAS